METGDDILAIEEDEISSGKNAKKLFKKIFWFVLRIGLAAVIIGWLVSSKYQEVMKGFENFNYRWLIPAALCYAIHMLACGWRWYKLLRVLNIDISLGAAISLTMKAYFFSLVIPGGAIGGDLAKVAFINSRTPKGSKIEGMFTILMDRIVGMVGLFSTAIVIILLTLPLLMSIDYPFIDKLNLSPELVRAGMIAGMLGLCVSGLAAMLAIFYHKTLEKIKPVGWLMHLGDKYTNNAISRMTAATDLYRNRMGLFSVMVLVTIVFVDLNLVLVVYFITRGLGMEHFQLMALTAAIIIGNISGLIPVTVAGVGVRDATVYAILVAGGINKDMTMTIPLIYTALILTFNILGGLFFVFDSDKKSKAGSQETGDRMEPVLPQRAQSSQRGKKENT